jgi:hypothetical protein
MKTGTVLARSAVRSGSRRDTSSRPPAAPAYSARMRKRVAPSEVRPRRRSTAAGASASDAGVLSVQWRTMRVLLRDTDSTSGPIVKPQWPLVFDLVDEPTEEWDLMEKRLHRIWVLRPVAERIGAPMKIAAQYPKMKPGPNFNGYE